MDVLARQRAAVEAETLPPHIGALFDQAVARFSGRDLWVSVDDGETLTYAEFAAEVARCVAALHRLGVWRGTHVALLLPSVPAL